MVYNIHYLIAGLIFLLLILYHFLGQRSLDRRNDRLFLFFIVTGASDMLLDLVCTILITMELPELRGTLEFLLVLLYLLQILVPLSFFGYINLHRRLTEQQWRSMMRFAMIPAEIMAVVVLTNHWTGWLFRVTAQGVYVRGPFYISMYLLAMLYSGIVGLETIVHFRQFERATVAVTWEFLVICGVSVAVQMAYNDLLMTSFGIALGISVLFLTINNPFIYTDNLTGVYDRRYFREFVQPHITRKRTIHCVGVDVSCLRRINRMYGAETGDRLLRQVAAMLRGNRNNWVFRFGGSQFVAAVTSLQEYEQLLKAAEAFSMTKLDVGGSEVDITLTVTGLIHSEELKTSEALFAYLEYLNTLAPNRDESFFVQGSENTLRGFRYQQQVEDYLAVAISEDKFSVHYQPVYSVSDGHFITLEALSRLQHPQLGYISPDIFISIAERCNYMTQIGKLQVRRICAFIRENRESLHHIRNVKINLSPTELLNIDHCRELISIIQESGVDPSFIHIEITESVATEYEDSLFRSVQEFLNAGVGLCMDDFGSGYANLNAVMRMPFTIIKLDKSMLIDICDNEQVRTLYAGIVQVFHSLGYQTVAEGVETKEELDTITALGVDMVQGYYFSKPLEPGKLLELLAK